MIKIKKNSLKTFVLNITMQIKNNVLHYNWIRKLLDSYTCRKLNAVRFKRGKRKKNNYGQIEL